MIVNQDKLFSIYVTYYIDQDTEKYVTYSMDPDTAKFSKFKWFKFVPRLISMWGIRKCHHFNPKLSTFAIANSFTAFFIYVLYWPKQRKQFRPEFLLAFYINANLLGVLKSVMFIRGLLWSEERLIPALITLKIDRKCAHPP